MHNIKTTKTIRFKLGSDSSNNLIQGTIDNLGKNNDFDLFNFVKNLNNFIDKLKGYLFSKGRNGGFYIKDKLILKSEWMKTYAKQELAEFKQGMINVGGGRIQYTIGDYGVSHKIEETLDYINEIYGELRDDASAELNERAKRARTALLLKRLYAKNSLPLLVDLVENINDKKETTDTILLLKSMGRKLLQQLEIGIQEYLPEQSSGFPIAKASFNYHTINKKPVDFDAKVAEIERKMIVNNLDIVWNNNIIAAGNGRLWNTIKADIDNRKGNNNLCLGDSPFMEVGTYSSLRQIMKNILAEQKAEFSELMQMGESLERLRKKTNLYLFNNIKEEKFNDYAHKTKEIEELATTINQCRDANEKASLRTKLNKLKQERGSLINQTIYKKFADLYRDVAQKHGRLLAQLKGIEKEKVESQTLQYWSLILEQDSKHKLVMIPKNKAARCKEQLNNSNIIKGEAKLYWFESFTFRSLQKLCFGNLDNGTNTFYPEIRRELAGKYSILDTRGYPKFISGEHEFKGDEQKKIRFYKDVLNSKYAKRTLNLPFADVENEIVNMDFETLDDFKIALEKICFRKSFTADAKLINSLIETYNAQVLDITSIDLSHNERVKDKEAVYSYTDKAHTGIWKEFWSAENENNKFDIRLNPEITITYRKPKESRVRKYGKDSGNYDPNKKNRYLHEQITLVTTISEHCNAPTKNISFTTDEEIKGMIDDFNNKINSDNIKFAFGIDNGEVELSTLGVYVPQFEKERIPEQLTELQKVEDYGFKTLTIKDLKYSETDINGKEKRIIQNVSYFLKEDLYCRTFGKTREEYNAMFSNVFEEKYLLSLDLSTAKVISGHIVTNGDVVSLFNLWMRHAQRNIFELNEHSDKEGGKRICLKKSTELNDAEKRKFIDYLNDGNKKYDKSSEEEKTRYVNWIYNVWNEKFEPNKEFEKIAKEHKITGNYLHNVVMAVSFIGEELDNVIDIFNIRNVFKLRKDFYCLKSEEEIMEEINSYNVRKISNEELDLKLNQIKSALVANVVGVVDYLYKQYKERFDGEGVIAKEGFNSSKIESDRTKFSGNIYRLLERKLYQKFQNYGLVPPIKNLLSIRNEDLKKENDFMQLGNICFVGYEGTSQQCPVCEIGRLGHTETCSENCGFESKGIMHSNDGIAGFNIAKRGYRNINKR